MYTGWSKSKSSYLYLWKNNRYEEHKQHYLIQQFLSYKAAFFFFLSAWSLPLANSCGLADQDSSFRGVTAVQGHLEHGLFSCHCCNHWNSPPSTSWHSRLCLVSISTQQVLMNGNGCHFLYTEEFKSTPFLCTHFHVRHRSVWLPLYCHLSHSNKGNRLLMGRFKLYYHTTNVHLWHCG